MSWKTVKTTKIGNIFYIECDGITRGYVMPPHNRKERIKVMRFLIECATGIKKDTIRHIKNTRMPTGYWSAYWFGDKVN